MTYGELISEVQARHPEVITGQMFGMACLKSGGKAIAGEWQGATVFKLSLADAEAALKLPGAHLFDPMGGRPMKQWVVVPPEQSAEWPGLADRAMANLA